MFYIQFFCSILHNCIVNNRNKKVKKVRIRIFSLLEIRYNIKIKMWTGLLKVSKFQHEFMKSSFLPIYELKIVRISALYCATLQNRNPY